MTVIHQLQLMWLAERHAKLLARFDDLTQVVTYIYRLNLGCDAELSGINLANFDSK